MSPDELKAIPKGSFIVMKTGTNPMRTQLRLFLDWGITFGKPYQTAEHGQRRVYPLCESETGIMGYFISTRPICPTGRGWYICI